MYSENGEPSATRIRASSCRHVCLPKRSRVRHRVVTLARGHDCPPYALAPRSPARRARKAESVNRIRSPVRQVGDGVLHPHRPPGPPPGSPPTREATGAQHDRGDRLELEDHRGVPRQRGPRRRPLRRRADGPGAPPGSQERPRVRQPDDVPPAGEGSVERGTESYKVTVREPTGAERDRVYAEQARRYPGFADYERQTAGIRTIPVLELTRV
jgi:hypothetical protein